MRRRTASRSRAPRRPASPPRSRCRGSRPGVPNGPAWLPGRNITVSSWSAPPAAQACARSSSIATAIAPCSSSAGPPGGLSRRRRGPWSPGRPVAASSSFSPWEYPLAPGRLHRLSGAVHLTADLRISASDTLVIDPGAVLRLDPDVSIISRGRVLALGTAARPIRLTRADPARPWGALALQGSGADSSRFSYVTFEWGGGALIDRIEYSGMVNVH